MKHFGGITRIILAGVLAAVLPAGAAFADSPDAWITTKAKMALLTTDGVGGTGINVDTAAGQVTLHGKVASDAEKQAAEKAVKGIEGVKSLKNLLQVVPANTADRVDASDDQLKDRVSAALEADRGLAGADVTVRSVNKGVVLLGGDAKSLTEHLRAIEVAANVPGVRRVESQIKSPDKVANTR